MRQRLLEAMRRATDATFAETVEIRPITGGGYVAGGPDPSRPVVRINAHVFETPNSVSGNGTNPGGGNASVVMTHRTVKFATEDVPYALTSDDHVVIHMGGTPWVFSISSVLVYDVGETILHLSPQAVE